MIVRCEDGFYYKNPSWITNRLVVRCEAAVEIYLKYGRPVSPRTILKALSALGLTGIAVPVVDLKLARGDMTSYIFEGDLHRAFNVTASFAKASKKLPVPHSHIGRFEIRPDNLEDEIIDYGDRLAKNRRRVGRHPQKSKG